MQCQDLAVPATVMRHVVKVESGANPYAIGVVGARLVRQPKSLDEAVATARMLEAKGFNYSLGMAQVNRANLLKYGLDSHAKAFDPCANLSAGARILAGCYASAGGDWGKAFSCYYSGNFSTGFQHGYVQRIFDSINQGTAVADNGAGAAAIGLLQVRPAATRTFTRAATPGIPGATSAPQRIAMRSVSMGQAPPDPVPAPAAAATSGPALAAASKSEVFVPQVRGPGDAPGAAVLPPSTATRPGDRADLRKEGSSDQAFVF